MSNSVAIDGNVTAKQIRTLAIRIAARLAALETPEAFKAVRIRDNNLEFYASTDTTVTPLTSIDLPEELYLSQTGTEIVENFSFSSVTYPGATDPNLDGKTVLVLAVRGDNANGLSSPTIKYSFVPLTSIFNNFIPKIPVQTITPKNIALVDANGNVFCSPYSLEDFVLAIDGKGLSSNDYTTAEKNKLATIAANANNYSLPSANSSTVGGMKLYSTTGSNSDGSITQKAITDALAEKLNTDANAVSATKLKTARNITTNLASTTAGSFDGTASVSAGVSGVLPRANGGTGTSSGITVTLTGDVTGSATASAGGAVNITTNVIPASVFYAANGQNDETAITGDDTYTHDVNKLITEGFYRIGTPAKTKNLPATGGAFYIIVLRGVNTACTQLAIQTVTPNALYFRCFTTTNPKNTWQRVTTTEVTVS